MNYEKIGEFIANKRKEKGLTQKELALKLGVTDKAVSKWERGLGCPDVSILEILSSELGVSILEILKGRIIENEVIKVTEANDYVVDTLKYTKNQKNKFYKDLLLNIISIIIFSIIAILLFLNINHLIYLNNYEKYNFDSGIINYIKENYNIVNKNIEIIRKNKGIYSTEDYEKILNYLNDLEERYNNMDLLKYEGNKKFNLQDLYIFDLKYPLVLSNIQIYDVLIKYNKNIENSKQLYSTTYYSKGTFSMKVMQEPSNMYKYNIAFKNNDFVLSQNDNYRISSRVYDYYYNTTHDVYLTSLIKEVGDINE